MRGGNGTLRFLTVVTPAVAPGAGTVYYCGGNPFQKLRRGLGWAIVVFAFLVA